MRSNRSNPTATHHGEEGISSVISTTLMICLAVIIVVIVVALILSEPLPDDLPHAAIFARNESGNFTLAHMAGDPLKEGAYRIYVDTIHGLIDETANFTGLKDGIWSAGEILTYSGMEELERVVITAISGGTEVILAELGPGGRSGVPTPTTIPTTIPTTGPTQVPLVAGFTANPTFGSAPLTVQFTDTSAGGATSWSWDFGDGNTSTAQNPTHTYADKGNYTVKLTVKNTEGSSNTVTKIKYIIVTEDHVSRLEVNTVREIILFGWNVPVNDISIDYSRDSETGSGKTPFVLSKIAPGDSSFSATLTAPDKIQILIVWFIPITMDFDHWQVDDTSYGKNIRTITVLVANDESRTATAYYKRL